MTGPKRVTLLHNLLSQDIQSLKPGDARLSALMDVKGHQVAWMRVAAFEDRICCETSAATIETVEATFQHYRVGAPVRFAKRDLIVACVVGAVNPEAPASAFPLPSIAGVDQFKALDVPLDGHVLYAPRGSWSALEHHLRERWGEPLSVEAFDVLRIESGIPWHGPDVGEENLLHETGQLALYHSSSKGCYLGQEIVARLEGRGGHVNRRLCGLSAPVPLEKDAELFVADKAVGRVTTAGTSPDFGFIAMGYVHRSVEVGGVVSMRVGGDAVDVVVRALPFRT